MKPIIDHVQITVKNLDAAEPFYDRLMDLLGFDVSRKCKARIEQHDFSVIEYPGPGLAFAITSPRAAFIKEDVHRRKPGALHHIAFRAGSKEEVEGFHRELLAMGAEIVGGPQFWPEHGEDYYAVFFKDPDGIKFEVVHNPHDH